MSTEDAKAYLSKREVPRLFECLMTGLMFHRPIDHIQYLIDSLEKVKLKGQADLTWNMFVEVRSSKTPLPPITPENGRRPISRGRTPKAEEVRPNSSTPLPPIGSGSSLNSDVPVVFIMGGPGSGKAMQAEKLCEKHPGWININLGNLLREKMLSKGAEGKWKTVKDLVIKGELAPEDITMHLIQKCMQNNSAANGFIIQGFPRDMKQAEKFEKMITRVDAVFLLDCEEEHLTNIVLSRGQNTGRLDDSPGALARRMATFKEHTLPVLKHFDDLGKLYIVNGDQDQEATHDELSIIFETLLQSRENGRIPSPPTEGRPATGRRSRKSATPPLASFQTEKSTVTIQMPPLSYIPPPTIMAKDEGRKEGLPEAPIIFVAGGPGSGKGTQCQLLMKRYPDIAHLSLGDILRKNISEKGSVDEKWGMITKLLKEGEMAPTDVTEELLIEALKDAPDAKAYMVEGYPRDVMQYEDFNRNIGGHSFTILLDCDEQYLKDRLIDRGASGNERIDDNIPAIEKKVTFFARNTLPLLKAIEDEKKLIVINGDRDEQEVFYDIVKCVDFSVYGTQLEDVNATSSSAVAETAEGKDEDDDAATAGGGGGGGGVVVEEMMMASTASVPCGDTIANPAYSKELDSLQDGGGVKVDGIDDSENQVARDEFKPKQEEDISQEDNSNEVNKGDRVLDEDESIEVVSNKGENLDVDSDIKVEDDKVEEEPQNDKVEENDSVAADTENALAVETVEGQEEIQKLQEEDSKETGESWNDKQQDKHSANANEEVVSSETAPVDNDADKPSEEVPMSTEETTENSADDKKEKDLATAEQEEKKVEVKNEGEGESQEKPEETPGTGAEEEVKAEADTSKTVELEHKKEEEGGEDKQDAKDGEERKKEDEKKEEGQSETKTEEENSAQKVEEENSAPKADEESSPSKTEEENTTTKVEEENSAPKAEEENSPSKTEEENSASKAEEENSAPKAEEETSAPKEEEETSAPKEEESEAKLEKDSSGETKTE